MICARSRFARFALYLAVLSPLFLSAQTPADHPLLLRNPSLSQDKIAFLYADDIWTVSRQGGDAERLTSNGHVQCRPILSPQTAPRSPTPPTYTAIPTSTSLPLGVACPVASPGTRPEARWLAGRRTAKTSSSPAAQLSYRHFLKLFLVHADGSGMPEPLPLPAGSRASFSPDGQSLAYEPITKWEPAWKRYVGGQTTPIWIVNLKTLDLVKVPRDNSNDSNPVWAGNSSLLPL